MESVKKLNDFLQPYYTLITALLFFGGIFIAAYKYLIAPSDLKVIVSTEEVNYPSSIGG